MKITDSIQLISNIQANSYLIVKPDELKIIDTGASFRKVK